MSTTKKTALVSIMAAGMLGFLWAGSAGEAFGEPHETRIVGPYKFVVGFKKEPTFIDESNAADIFVSRASDNRPINRDAGDTVDLEVEVQLRDREAFDSRILRRAVLEDPLTQAFRTDNEYNSWFKPTEEGPYAFRITGVVSDDTDPKAGSMMLDETFFCGHGTLAENGHGFHCVAIPQPFPGHAQSR